MTPPHRGEQPDRIQRPRTMMFRKRSTASPPTPEQSKRQSDVVQSAWRHFGAPGPGIAFLNTRHDALDGLPLHLAIESDAGLERVQTVLERLTLEA